MIHILTECENFEKEREVIIQNWGMIQIWEIGHIFKVKNVNHQNFLGIFLLKVRGKRAKTLKGKLGCFLFIVYFRSNERSYEFK